MDAMRVREIMQRGVPTLRPGDTYRHVAQSLLESRMRALPVVDSCGRILGIVSESDLLRRPDGRQHVPGFRRRVRTARRVGSRATAHELMTAPAVTVSPRDTVAHAAELAARADVRQLPVVDDDDQVLGMVTRLDLLEGFARDDEQIREDIVRNVLVGAFCSDPVSVDVTVREGVATLCGQLEHQGLHASFVRAVAAVPGVIGIDDQLTWPAPPRPAGIHAFYMYAL